MTTPSSVSLKRIVEELDCRPSESTAYLDLETGECMWLYDSILGAVEDGTEPDLEHDCEPEDLQRAAVVLANPARFRELPSQHDIDEWNIMVRFIESLDDSHAAGHLARAIRGTGAFRRFKDEVIRFGVQKQWFAFKENALAESAVDWLQDNSVEFVRDLLPE